MNATPATQPRPDTRTDTAGRRIPYPFDAPPKLLHDLVRDKTLKGRDQAVLVELLRWRFLYQNSCWVIKAIIARNLHCSVRTVQRSLARLHKANVIRQVAVSLPGHPDPDEPRNRTGWRIHFPWITTDPSQLGPAPDRRTNDRRKKPTDPGQSETLLSPPPMTVLSPPWETPLSPNLRVEGNQQRTETTTTASDTRAQRPADIHAFPKSSSSLAALFSNPAPESVPFPATGASAPIPADNAVTQPIAKTVVPAVSLPSPANRGAGVVASCTPVMVQNAPAVVHPSVGMIEVTPTVPAQVLGLPTEGLDQALLMVLVVRVVRLSAGFKVGANWTAQQARDAILGLLRTLGCPLWWISNAVDQAERRPRAKRDNKPVESWGFIRQTVSNWTHGDGTPGSPPGSKPAAPPGVPCPGDPSRDGKPSRPPPGSSLDAIEKELCELTAAELQDRIVEMEATLASLSSSPRLRLSEQLRGQLAQAKSLLSAREVGA
jgi:hypothetical protein